MAWREAPRADSQSRTRSLDVVAPRQSNPPRSIGHQLAIDSGMGGACTSRTSGVRGRWSCLAKGSRSVRWYREPRLGRHPGSCRHRVRRHRYRVVAPAILVARDPRHQIWMNDTQGSRWVAAMTGRARNGCKGHRIDGRTASRGVHA